MNYQIDGGDNNDDTVGGLLQLFPLEAIQEFNFITQRYKAEYGRSNGGVMNIVTKSGTNNFKGSCFTAFRDKSLNATTETAEAGQHRQAGLPPLPVRRVLRRADRPEPGALLRGRSSARSRTRTQTVNTLGLFPEQGRDLPHADAREPVHGEGVGEPHARRSS